MNAWQELVKQALIGNFSSKQKEPLLLNKLNQYGLTFSDEDPSEKKILKAAAIHNKLYAAAQIPLQSNNVSTSSSPSEKLAYCSLQRKYQLEYILKHNYSDILVEFLELIAQKKRIVPPELLPELLSYGRNRPYLHERLTKCIGKRGVWLAQFSDEWKYAKKTSNEDDDIFFYGKRDERLHYITKIHGSNPKEAILLLEQVWESEDYITRTDFIKSLQGNLNQTDEPFLEKALQDSRQEVRNQSANLLALLPESKLVDRMKKLIEGLISYDPKKNKLTIELPLSCTTEMKRDGISPRKIFVKDHGPKANQLAQIIAKIPAEWWQDTFSKNPQELLLLASKTEWKNIFLWGWAMAAKNFESKDWILACHRFYLDTFFKHNWSNFSIEFLYEDLPNNLFNLLALEYLKTDTKETLSDDHPVVNFLLAEGQMWDDAISRKVIHRIKNTIQQDTYVFHWSLKTVLKRASFSISPLLYDKIEEGWPTQSKAWYSWQKEVDHLLSILKFRLEILNLDD
jgi:hypothetical protein